MWTPEEQHQHVVDLAGSIRDWSYRKPGRTCESVSDRAIRLTLKARWHRDEAARLQALVHRKPTQAEYRDYVMREWRRWYGRNPAWIARRLGFHSVGELKFAVRGWLQHEGTYSG